MYSYVPQIAWLSDRRVLRVEISVISTPPKITQLRVVVLVQQDILGFDVSVHYAFRVDVLEGHRDLVEELEGELLCHPGPRVDEEEQSPVVRVFEQDVYHVLHLDRTFEPDDVRVSQGPVDLNFLLQICEMDGTDLIEVYLA